MDFKPHILTELAAAASSKGKQNKRRGSGAIHVPRLQRRQGDPRGRESVHISVAEDSFSTHSYQMRLVALQKITSLHRWKFEARKLTPAPLSFQFTTQS